MSKRKVSKDKTNAGSQEEEAKNKEPTIKKDTPVLPADAKEGQDPKHKSPSVAALPITDGWSAGGETVIDSAKAWSQICNKLEQDERDFFYTQCLKVLGWKISEKMVKLLYRLLPGLKRLEKFSFSNTRMSSEMFTSLINTIPLCTSLREVTLDGNPLPNHCYHLLLSDECSLTHVRLRNNQISDEGAALIGCALSTPKSTNKTLLSLSLAFNNIGDVGAGHIAKGLRLNRTLLFLSLANNSIGDAGAAQLAAVFSEFALTHDEIMERRRLIFDKLQMPAAEVEVPVQPSETFSPTDLLPAVPDSSSPVNKANAKKPDSKADEKLKKPPKNNKKAEMKLPPSKITKPPPRPITDEEFITPPEEKEDVRAKVNILLDKTGRRRDGEIFLPGNTCLASLNLSGNHLTEKSLAHFLRSLQEQAPVGVLRLCLQRNNFPLSCPTFEMIEELMSYRDPIINKLFTEEHA
ncbi:leucine-rich repeat-containing protein 71 isoform X2 [Synchiropus splendidus]|uniref:leucine-rich repeat-containing protein 71 isoform X2 n=1 Tax=Synchiropus splendidus TaxID=270530 RepID=UPI00237ECD0A|nr:leucine-rich repeat-containing protein 71 isoform X2 [Synchiropus splendidus]